MSKDYTIITKNRVCDSEPEKIIKEQEEKRKLLGLKNGQFLCHFFNSSYMKESFHVMPIDFAIQFLAAKDGYDMVQFKNGNYGFVAYCNGKTNGFEVIG